MSHISDSIENSGFHGPNCSLDDSCLEITCDFPNGQRLLVILLRCSYPNGVQLVSLDANGATLYNQTFLTTTFVVNGIVGGVPVMLKVTLRPLEHMVGVQVSLRAATLNSV